VDELYIGAELVVDIHVADGHAPRQFFNALRPTVCFGVDEVAPSADYLTHHHGGG